MTGPAKRSVTIAGHRTSVSMEPEFWNALRTIAADEGRSLADLLTDIDKTRNNRNLSSATRVFVLNKLKT
ncbi:MAG: ribbon-helix-helix domain-containing protein [Alphaproteobacteria bacterium]|nr:ribbon-helix-helix domain-containing protein [Alphaproteobacteria bacterium]